MRCGSCGLPSASGRLYCGECGASLGHFVGREREVETLTGALEDALSGRPRLVLLAGEPGIGKTRTVEELDARARRRGAAVVWGRCHETEGAPAFWPWVQVVRTHLQSQDSTEAAAFLGGDAGDIAQIVPELRERFPGLPPPPALEPEQARFRLFDSTARLLRRAATGTPLVIVLDDLHLADRPSLLLLEFVAAELAAVRLLIVGTYRHTEVARHHPLSDTLSELARSPITERIILRGLAEREIARLIELIAGESPSGRVVHAIARHTEGNPFYIGELVPLLLAEGRLRADVADAFGLGVPQGVREVIGRRLNRLSGECNRILALASVIGRDFELQVLELLAEMPVDRLLELLQEATAAHVIAEVPRRAGHYAFSHALIRETLYEELSSLRRVQLHRRVGEVLERLHGSGDAHLPELAYHFYAAAPGGDSERAVDYAARAGARATARLAYEEAAGHYRRALELLDVGGHADETRHSDLLLAQADAEMGAGDTVAARDTFLRAARLARRSGTPDQLARAALGLGTGLQGFWGYGAGFVDELVVSLLEESLAELGASDSPLRALLLGRLAVALYWSPVPERREPIRRLGTDAVEMARRVGDPTVELVSLASRHWADWRPENVGERLAAAEGVLRLATRLGHREMSLLGHALHLADSLELGNVAAVDADLEAFARLAEEVRQPRYAWWSTMFRTMRSLLEGRFAEGERLAGEAFTTGQKAQASDAAQTFGVHMYTIRREQGGLDELAAATQALGDQYRTIPTWRCGVALLLAEAGRIAEARRELDALAASDFAELPRDLVWLTSMALLAETAALLDDGPRAAVLHEQLAPYGDRCIVIPYGIACFGSASRPLGLLASTLRRWPEAEQHFEAALAVNRRMGARPWVARTERDYAAMLLARGTPDDRERARVLLSHARATAAELGMTRLAEHIARLADGGSGETARAASEPNVFRREGDFWTLAYDGATCRLKDLRGLHYLAHLIRHPGEEFHARDLVLLGVPREERPRETSAGALLDTTARSEYRRRLAELREDLEEAEGFNDVGRAARAREEMEFIAHELSAAVGLGGRDREAVSSAERARLAVTKRIKGALSAIRGHHPALGRHLDQSIRTGQFCAYTPPAGTNVAWNL